MRRRDDDPDEFDDCTGCRNGMREVTEVFARQEAGVAIHENLEALEAAAVADARRIEEARARHEPTENTTAAIDRWQKFRAMLNTVYPCPRCRPAQFAKWRAGCYQPGHVAKRCKVCTAATAEARR